MAKKIILCNIIVEMKIAQDLATGCECEFLVPDNAVIAKIVPTEYGSVNIWYYMEEEKGE